MVNIFNESAKIPTELPDGTLVYRSEIHALVEIGKFPGLNVTELAEKLMITKGAITQVTKKLEKKSLITRTKDFNNDKEIGHYLTEKGKQLHKQHDEHIEQIVKESKLNNISDDNFSFLQSFLTEILQHKNK